MQLAQVLRRNSGPTRIREKPLHLSIVFGGIIALIALRHQLAALNENSRRVVDLLLQEQPRVDPRLRRRQLLSPVTQDRIGDPLLQIALNL